jgi:hypothetical protein
MSVFIQTALAAETCLADGTGLEIMINRKNRVVPDSPKGNTERESTMKGQAMFTLKKH